MSIAVRGFCFLVALAPSIALSSSALPPLPVMENLPVLGGGTPLQLEEVLRHVEVLNPILTTAQARTDAASALEMSARGGFDPQLNVSGFAAPFGYYQYLRSDVSVTQATPLWGMSMTAGWRLGRSAEDSSIPIYYGEQQTLRNGEVRGAISLPLWRDGPIDARRANIRRAEQSTLSAQADQNARRLRLIFNATESYYRWVAAAQKAQIAINLLYLAEERDLQVSRRVAAGAIPSIEHLENRRAIFERRAFVVTALRALERATIALSFYVRDEHQQPILVEAQRAPLQLLDDPHVEPQTETLLAQALSARPELARLKASLQSQRIAADLNRNQIGPRLDLSCLGSLDLGTGNPKDTTLKQYNLPVMEVSLNFSLPLGMRDARGKLQASNAEIRALQAELQQQEDQIRIEVQDATSAWQRAKQNTQLNQNASENAEQVATGERIRFENGTSTLLLVNLREFSAAQARAAVIDSKTDWLIAEAFIQAASATAR